MVRIRNTEPERKPTRALYNADLMGDHYDPPGIRFTEADGAVAQVRQEVVDDLLEAYAHFERAEADDEAASDGDTSGTDDDASTDD